MYVARHGFVYRIAVAVAALLLSAGSPAADWASISWDNDVFVGRDHGYTNGLFFSWYETDMDELKPVAPSWLVTPLLWSLSETTPIFKITAGNVGQMMVTPRDIKTEVPDPRDIPYSGLLFYTSGHYRVYENHADKISTTVGIIGPSSGAEQMQKIIHELNGSAIPRGWEHQLRDEPVFRFSRSRIWRIWTSGHDDTAGNFDLLTSAEANLGTIESSLAGAVMLRYGSGLTTTYVTPAFQSNRSANPLAIDGGWFIYVGVSARLLANQIFIDGNTFRDSPSTELDHTQFGVAAGLSIDWENFSITLAVEDLSTFESQYDSATRVGSLSVAWRL